MVSNYPDGMTTADWEHIAGPEHLEDCPLHEDACEEEGDVCRCDDLYADAKEDAAVQRYEERREEGR